MTKKEPDAVMTSFTKNKDKGWGVIAKEMGISDNTEIIITTAKDFKIIRI